MPFVLPAAKIQPPHVGMDGGRFRENPRRPNYVNTQLEDGPHAAAPLRYSGSREHARSIILAIIEDDPRAELKRVLDDYLHAEWRAMVFIDDVEFYLPTDEKVVHVRSISRLGRSDLGANRRRYRKIAAAFSSRV